MKGISHFVSGVAAGSFLPDVVRRSQEGSFVLLLAGLGGIMPDLLDFRFGRYVIQPDVKVDPGSASFAPQSVAEQIAGAIERCRDGGQAVQVRLFPARCGPEVWRSYTVQFDDTAQAVMVYPGQPACASPTSHPGSASDIPIGRAAISTLLCGSYDSPIAVDMPTGCELEFRPCGDRVELVYLPWHRRWSHSFIVSALLGGIVTLALGPTAGLLYALGSGAHILQDQLGYMGTNLLYPITRRRTPGLGWFHSGDTLPNLFAVWLSAILVLFNLDRFAAASILNPWSVFGFGLALPWTAILFLSWWGRRRRGEYEASRNRPGTAEVTAEAEEMMD